MGAGCVRGWFWAADELYGLGAQKPWFLSKIGPDPPAGFDCFGAKKQHPSDLTHA
jgi:hypothetical protein